MKISDLPKVIPLTQGKFAIVDADKYEWLNQWKWYASCGKGKCYARRTKRIGKRIENKKINIYMHHEVLRPLIGFEIDHISGNALDNRSKNLRICLHAENQRNRTPQKGGTSKHKGVFWNAKYAKWQVQIEKDNKRTYLGRYSDEDKAARAYNHEAVKQFGEYARVNEI